MYECEARARRIDWTWWSTSCKSKSKYGTQKSHPNPIGNVEVVPTTKWELGGYTRAKKGKLLQTFLYPDTRWKSMKKGARLDNWHV